MNTIAGPPTSCARSQQPPHDRDVPAMHAVEIADRHGAATRRGRQGIEMANDVHEERGAGSTEPEVNSGTIDPLAV